MVWRSHEFEDFRTEVTCPCCGGGCDILWECYGHGCELCGMRGQVYEDEAEEYEKQYATWEKARDRVLSGQATPLDLLTAGAVVVAIRV